MRIHHNHINYTYRPETYNLRNTLQNNFFFIIPASDNNNLFTLETCQYTKLKLNGLILRVNNKNKMHIKLAPNT